MGAEEGLQRSQSQRHQADLTPAQADRRHRPPTRVPGGRARHRHLRTLLSHVRPHDRAPAPQAVPQERPRPFAHQRTRPLEGGREGRVQALIRDLRKHHPTQAEPVPSSSQCPRELLLRGLHLRLPQEAIHLPGAPVAHQNQAQPGEGVARAVAVGARGYGRGQQSQRDQHLSGGRTVGVLGSILPLRRRITAARGGKRLVPLPLPSAAVKRVTQGREGRSGTVREWATIALKGVDRQ